MKNNILFLCTGNSCRSQMAEGWARSIHGDKYNFYSAGINRSSVNPKAEKVMLEAGVDISSHSSKTIDDLKDIDFDIIVTVCSGANENCPYVPGADIIHFGFDDPPALEKSLNDPEEQLAIYRRVRDEIKAFIYNLSTEISKHKMQENSKGHL